MKILGIDTSSMAASVSVIEDDKLICEYTVNTKKTHSQKLMPMIENMLKMSDLKINEINAIAICVGPGSFTGLRIGMATAKAIAHVNNLPIIGVNSMEILAANMDLCDKKICSILDAQRNQVYTAKYKFEEGKLIEIESVDVIEIENLLKELSSNDDEWILVGEAVYKYKDMIKEIQNISIPAPSNNVTKASSLCSVAINKYNENKDVHDCYTINPMYIRKSQAEVQYEEKMKRLNNDR
ncbi:tRNA (adenosine(37)-N6)-threonylcarbamoyltransferase complex dimerization subunit type 1 TsaB [Romboutsia maritimum]|uniref:tRNA (Adenosine(37)-N6)-threonylcarbamoyltransferase complex dimerization subunit type 1 TsaB n=1 Tax=Romboutsia maritimum TaxID=2020948 RepID=A0A371IRZ6_9FIRM|nr:tRNA (adenosine(37)-N6)-threonylcarbamoyltransferase complex dimerization subunit type 1 TsaB [Romboutsia maritimum]RDY23249.1 tRNA (adenosine(37)-N6)-threonylcarbamoyltransferase complex dimerization subunit type 1 TsaB [Romboutsia maritimum]